MLSQTVEYALQAMVQLAADAPEASTTKAIAKKTKVPGAYLAKVLQSMRRAGLIHSRRGVGGGVALARPPRDISLMDVIDAVEPLRRGSKKRKGASTPLQRRLDDAIADLRQTFANSSLADMLATPRRKKAARRKSAPKGSRARRA